MVNALEMELVGVHFGMRVSVLASSSSGNATYIATPGHCVLVDAGLSGCKIVPQLCSIGRDLTDVASVFITQAHSDHVRGVGVLARRYPQLNVYANACTFAAYSNAVGKIPVPQLRLLAMGTT